MSNISNFIILVGTGHPYGGEGIAIQGSISQHMKKGGWLLDAVSDSDGNRRNIYWIRDNLEDALLMISLYLVAPFTPKDDPFQHLLKKAQECFKRSLFASGMDIGNAEEIAPHDLRQLYRMNQESLADSDVKLVAIQLGEFPERSKEQFVTMIKKYNLKNVEFVETTFARYFGGFDAAVREFHGKD